MINEASIRLTAFLAIFAAVTIWELASPRRQLSTSKGLRWLSNICITVLGTATVRGIFPVLAATLAANETSLGILNQVSLPYVFKVFIGVLALDFIIYFQHVMFHAVPVFWRLHMMHHADLDYDVTTALRFHPVEILISMGIKFSAILVLGPSALTVIAFEIILNATAMFNHGNIRLPLGIDKVLRLLVVTPDMHRVHHSVTIRETNSNFGFSFPWWDRLFGTYRPQPVAGHEGMTIGLSQFRDAKKLTLPWLLALPFIGDKGSYSIDKSGREPVKMKK